MDTSGPPWRPGTRWSSSVRRPRRYFHRIFCNGKHHSPCPWNSPVHRSLFMASTHSVPLNTDLSGCPVPRAAEGKRPLWQCSYTRKPHLTRQGNPSVPPRRPYPGRNSPYCPASAPPEVLALRLLVIPAPLPQRPGPPRQQLAVSQRELFSGPFHSWKISSYYK